jgi:hypothetical protein
MQGTGERVQRHSSNQHIEAPVVQSVAPIQKPSEPEV